MLGKCYQHLICKEVRYPDGTPELTSAFAIYIIGYALMSIDLVISDLVDGQVDHYANARRGFV